MHKKLQGKLGGLAICVCLVSMICSEGLAAQFQWYNDPNSTTDFTFFSRSCAQTASDPCTNNTIRLADIQAVNLIDQPLSDVRCRVLPDGDMAAGLQSGRFAYQFCAYMAQ